MKKLTFGFVACGLCIASLQGCQEKWGDDCTVSDTCSPSGDGDGDGDLGGSSSGGTGDGDGDGDGDTGGTGTGGTPALTCEDLECADDTPHCDEDEVECVECLENAHCEADAPVCDQNECTGCIENSDCAEHPDTPVCDDASGACVGCLTEDDCGGNVCAPQTNTCTDLEAQALFACQSCVHDAECQAGQLCMPQYFGTPSTLVGNFCTWTQEARVGEGACLDDGKPFAASSVEPVTSTDGASAVLCVLRSTTCPAFMQHSQAVDGCTAPNVQNSACGAPDLDDGLCREPNGGGSARCTYPCGGPEDSKQGYDCHVEGYRSL